MQNDNKKRPNKTERKWLAIPFFAVLAVLTVVAFIIPLRPTQSYSEKRNLAQFPEFSPQALVSGDYFDDISLWFSDTFPFREGWISLAGKVEQFHGINDITIYGNLPPADAVPSAAPTPAPVSTPEIVDWPVEELPVEVPEVVVTLPPEESVEQWGGIEVDGDAEVIFGSVLQIGNSAFAYYGFSQSGSDRYINMMNHCAEVMDEKGVEVYSVLAPTSVGVMVASDYMEMLGCTDQGESISYILSGMNDKVKKVNTFNNLVAHNDEYIYFRTDHHWSALGAYYAYEEFCKTAGMEAAPLDAFELWDQGTFKGSYYYNCKQNFKLEPDTVYAYNPPGDLEMMITARGGNTFPWTVLTDVSKSKDNAKYMVFLAGDHPLSVITNNDLPEGESCVVIKDSFGNPFVPFLTQNYHKVYVMDYRSYSKMKLRNFVDVYEIDDVIFLESLAMAQGDGTLDLLESLTK